MPSTIIYTDASLNQGCYVIGDQPPVTWTWDQKLTVNQAEYEAIYTALKAAKRLGLKDIEIRSDSQLAIRQLSGQYAIWNPALARRAATILWYTGNFNEVEWVWCPREENQAGIALEEA